MSELKIRALERRDRKTLTALLEKLIKADSGKGIYDLIVSGTQNSEAVEQKEDEQERKLLKISVDIISRAIRVLDEDVAAWFADLIGKSVEEFDHLPFDVETEILSQIVEADNFAGFFTGALRASSKIKTLLLSLKK
jgi:hypothetical protein